MTPTSSGAARDGGEAVNGRTGNPRRRNRASAKKAGASFNSSIARALARHVNPDIEVRHTNGAKDRGDVSGLRHMGQPIVVECKNEATIKLGPWANETEIERGNADAVAGFIVHKRHGRGDPLDQWVTGTLRDFISLLTGGRPDDDLA